MVDGGSNEPVDDQPSMVWTGGNNEPVDDQPDGLNFNLMFLEVEGAADQANDDFDPLELPQTAPEDGHWVPCEQERELAGPRTGNCPKADLETMRATVNKTRQFLWKRAKTEICILRKHRSSELRLHLR